MFVPPRFDVYKAVSAQIHALFARYTRLIQPLSLDEAYLDVTAPLLERGSATAIAAEIRAAIRSETGLTASAGVSCNKFLAKLASDHRKPDGLFVITPKMGSAFVEDLPVGKFHGVDPVTAAKMNRLGIRHGPFGVSPGPSAARSGPDVPASGGEPCRDVPLGAPRGLPSARPMGGVHSRRCRTVQP